MLYPELETYRDYDASPDFNTPSCLERNCNQIFVKGPVLTREILEKMNADIVPKKTFLFGRERNTKNFIYVTGLCLLLSISLLGTIVAWFTNVYNNVVLSNLVISSNTSAGYKIWQHPSAKLQIKVYVFNYTNVENFRLGWDKKFRVKQLGPYIYEQDVERVNITFHNDSTISYQLKNSFTFLPKKSKGKQSDQVVVPNIPLLAGAALTEHQNYFTRLAFSGMLNGLGEKPFVQLPVDSFLMGYSSKFYEIARALSSFQNMPTPEKVGILSNEIGVDSNIFTTNSGKTEINRIGIIEKYNGKDHFNQYSTEECNKIESSEAAIYPPKSVQEKQNLNIFLSKACRRIPIGFNKEINILKGNIPAYQYSVPDDIFDSADEKPENQCYCHLSGQCAPKGLFNLTNCNLGVPIFASNPHFRRGDPSLFKYIDGLEPEKYTDKTVLNLHPFMGFAMSGRLVLQVNIQVRRPYGVQQVEMFKDDTVLPMVWIDTVLDEENMPQDFKDIIHEATFTVKGLRLAFKYGTVLTTLVTFISILLIWLRKHFKSSRANARGTVRLV